MVNNIINHNHAHSWFISNHKFLKAVIIVFKNLFDYSYSVETSTQVVASEIQWSPSSVRWPNRDYSMTTDMFPWCFLFGILVSFTDFLKSKWDLSIGQRTITLTGAPGLFPRFQWSLRIWGFLFVFTFFTFIEKCSLKLATLCSSNVHLNIYLCSPSIYGFW